jgi:hypothetical protein
MKILCNRIAFARAIANASSIARPMDGPLPDEQRKAMFAKLSRGGGGGGSFRGGPGWSTGRNDRSGGSTTAKAPITSAPPGKGVVENPSLPILRKPNPNSNWGPKDSRGNPIKPPEGSHWETRDGINFYPVPDDPRFIKHPMSSGLNLPEKPEEREPGRGVDPSGGVQLPFTPVTPEMLVAEGAGIRLNYDDPAIMSSPVVRAALESTAAAARARDIFSGDFSPPVHIEGMSQYANGAIEAVNKNWEYPKPAKEYFVGLLKKYGNPTDEQVRRALQLTDDAFDIGRGPGIRTFSINPTRNVSIPALVRQFRFGANPPPKKFSDFGPYA